MAYYNVKCQRVKNGQSSSTTWYERVQAESESEARKIAKDKAKMNYPDCKIAILEAIKT